MLLKLQRQVGDLSPGQGGRSCAGARVAPAEKFGLRRKFQARTYAILSRIKICGDLRTFFLRSLGIKSAFWGKNSASWARSALLHGTLCILY